jgi:DNA-binding MarR family transcriptional regulator
MNKKQEKIASVCSKSNIGRLLAVHKRAFDEWAITKLTERGYPAFKVTYFAVLMNIDEQGKTNKEIATIAKVTKQAMSKIVRELVSMKLVRIDYHPHDNRSALLFLTEKGRKMVDESRQMVHQLETEYEKLIGKKAFELYKKQTAQLILMHWPDFSVV